MTEIAENLESYILHLCQKAKDLGASQAVSVPVADVVVDERTILKCMVPVCSAYGVNLMCPPNVLPVSQFKEMLSCYHDAVLIKVDIPESDLPGEGGEKDEQSGTPPKPEYLNAARDARKKLHDIVSRVESLCIEGGYHFAAGLAGGSCPLCEECVGIKSGLPCRYPFKARPAMEAMGIDVMATAKKSGLRLGFGQNEDRSWIGLVLVA